ncbi:class I SAM-dependent methyltransferase [Ruegeria sp. EL01]|jgi:SAM-dependent methyltransferase|uniref:class I SAM-dependent methyltransferase n=1 Tax=Ruegeria sp. EL01 TaxID=2107578 RepID=UPI000EA7F78A|nr:class I SAM-dependent methyltransferase [Ruegeria sp. EL01]
MIDAGQGGNNHFLTGGAAYASSRPTYPVSLADALAERCGETQHALYVGCGSGQLSVLLADRFGRVTATDPSEGQLENATAHPRVTYHPEPAERIGLPEASVDLVTAAQAAHWFDLDAFYAEVRRVARPDALLALISYGVPTMDGAIGERLARFYWQDLHAHWPQGRRHVEEGYRTLAFPFLEEAFPTLLITREWYLGQFIAYVCTWSAAKRALAAGDGAVVDGFVRDLGPLWGNPEEKKAVTWPVVGRIAPVHA